MHKPMLSLQRPSHKIAGRPHAALAGCSPIVSTLKSSCTLQRVHSKLKAWTEGAQQAQSLDKALGKQEQLLRQTARCCLHGLSVGEPRPAHLVSSSKAVYNLSNMLTTCTHTH